MSDKQSKNKIEENTREFSLDLAMKLEKNEITLEEMAKDIDYFLTK